MKKLTFISALFLFTFTSYSQIHEDVVRRGMLGNNEVKFNVAAMLFPSFEVNYERIITQDMSVGAYLSTALDDDFPFRYQAMAYYRMYFGRKKANGWFIEANAGLQGTQDYVYNEYYDPENGYIYNYGTSSERTVASFGFGFATGWKWITRNGFTGEVFAGLGRMFNSNIDDVIYPRVGVSLGKRF